MNSDHLRHGADTAAKWLAPIWSSRSLRQFQARGAGIEHNAGAVSHGVNALEKWLDVELFDRRRDLVLTQAGLDYLSYISDALSTIAKGTSELLAAGQNTHEPPALLPD